MADAGIDISNHQNRAAESLRRPIDWPAVRAAGTTYGWVKVTESGGGQLYRDPYAATNAHAMRTAGLAAGGYHFARPGDPAEQARQFADYATACGLLTGGAVRPMLDVEDTGITDAWIAAWLAEFRRYTGVRRVIVYANRAFWRTRLHPDGQNGRPGWANGDVLLMLADYDGSTDRLQWTHPRLAVKQYTETGSVPGFPTPIDRDVTVNGYALADLLIEGDDMAWDTPLHLQDGEKQWTDPADVVVGAMAVKVNKLFDRLLGDDDHDNRDLLDTLRQVRTELGEWAQRTMAADRQQIAALQASVTALAGVIETLQHDQQGASAEDIKGWVAAAIRENVVQVDVHVQGTPAGG